jgi:hypothetical protein
MGHGAKRGGSAVGLQIVDFGLRIAECAFGIWHIAWSTGHGAQSEETEVRRDVD